MINLYIHFKVVNYCMKGHKHNKKEHKSTTEPILVRFSEIQSCMIPIEGIVRRGS